MKNCEGGGVHPKQSMGLIYLPITCTISKKKTFMWGNIPVPWMIWKMECSQTILTPPMQTPQTPVLTSKFRGVLKQVSGNLTLPVDPKKKKKNDRILGAT